ncbi:MAG TPA: redoxin domain-containing protein [Terriglobales bacterium]|nr:redoxin domain-containing protein [Terriglobales bacterium]
MFGSKNYNYRSFDREQLRKELNGKLMNGPQAGEEAPDFELPSPEGEKVRLSDYAGEKNVVLTFGSATCPMTAGSIRGLNRLYEQYSDGGVQFLFVYVREAHPGEDLPAHRSLDDKAEAAELFRQEEGVEMPILLDTLEGKVHRQYGGRPNSTYLIDKSGRVAFRAVWTRPSVVEEALEELLEHQDETGKEHAVVRGGEDTSLPRRYGMLHAHRALERGGRRAVGDFKEAMGATGRVAMATSRMAEPVMLHPIKAFAAVAIAGGVVAGALYAGMRLLQRRLQMRSPYYFPRPRRRKGEAGGYEAVGI